MKKKILVVDDERAIRETVMNGLNRLYDVVGAENADEAHGILENQTIHLCVVDVMMPGQDGFSLCKDIKSFYNIPVIMLTARSALNDKRIAFSSGSDDYLTKPFEVEELMFRIEAILKRYDINNEAITLGNVTIDEATYEVMIDSEVIYLPNKEFMLLHYLMKTYPKVASRETLIEAIWGYDFDGDERTVDVHIKRIRRRLESYDTTLEIQTIRGVGYKVHV